MVRRAATPRRTRPVDPLGVPAVVGVACSLAAAILWAVTAVPAVAPTASASDGTSVVLGIVDRSSGSATANRPATDWSGSSGSIGWIASDGWSAGTGWSCGGGSLS